MSKRDDEPTTTERWTKGGLERLLTVQRPAVLAHLRSVRHRHPDATPAQVQKLLEQRYLAAVTATGAGTGAAAAIPGVGTVTALAVSGAETVAFLEASALFAQSVAEVHGVPALEPERSSALVMALMLGTSGGELVQQFAREAAGEGGTRTAYWGELVTKQLPRKLTRSLVERIRSSFLKRFAARQGAGIVLRVVPFGIGAVIGGTGNHLAGRRVVKSAREAFGPAPETFPEGFATSPKALAAGADGDSDDHASD